MAIRHRFVYPLVFAFMLVGLMVSTAGIASASTSRDIASTPDHPDCASHEFWFYQFSELAGQYYNDGDYENSTLYTQWAAIEIDQARSLGCSWPNEVFPPLDPPCVGLFCGWKK